MRQGGCHIDGLFGLTVVDVPSNVEVTVVAADFVQRHHPAVVLHLGLVFKGGFVRAGDVGDVLGSQAVLGLAFKVVAAGVDDDDLALERSRLALVQDEHAGRNAGVVKQRGG